MVEATLEKPVSMPNWCAELFPEQVKALQKESDQCREQVKKIASRLDYIQNIFTFCTRNLDGLDFDDPQIIATLTKVLGVLGWKVKALESVPMLIQLVDEDKRECYAIIATSASPLDRVKVGALIMAQTQYWETSGKEASGFIIHDPQKSGAVGDDVLSYAVKRSIAVLSKSILVGKAAEVLIAEADPDDVRASLFVGKA